MTFDVQKLTNTNQLDLMNQLMIANQELNRKDIEIATLTSQNEQLRSELRTEKELNERMNKPSAANKYFEDLMKFPKKKGDTTGLGYNSSTEKGESSNSGEKKKTRGKPTCHYYGKKGHTANVCRRKNGS